MHHYKVIFHIDEMSKWKLLLANVNNLIQDLENQTITVEVLANSEAVKFFILNEINEKDYHTIALLLNKSVQFCVCNNSLKSNNISPDSLISGIHIVSSGVSELMIKQHEGFAYIKP